MVCSIQYCFAVLFTLHALSSVFIVPCIYCIFCIRLLLSFICAIRIRSPVCVTLTNVVLHCAPEGTTLLSSLLKLGWNDATDDKWGMTKHHLILTARAWGSKDCFAGFRQQYCCFTVCLFAILRHNKQDLLRRMQPNYTLKTGTNHLIHQGALFSLLLLSIM